jgi:hypothetical protein
MKKLLGLAFVVAVMGSAAGCVVDDTYTSCSSSSDCRDSGDQCWLVQLGPAGTSGQFCSTQCTTDDSCEKNLGFSGACYSLEGTNFLCYQRCVVDSDCYLSSVCVEVARTDGGLDYVCAPNN